MYLMGWEVTETSPVAPTGFGIFSKTELKWKTKVFVMLYTAVTVYSGVSISFHFFIFRLLPYKIWNTT